MKKIVTIFAAAATLIACETTNEPSQKTSASSCLVPSDRNYYDAPVTLGKNSAAFTGWHDNGDGTYAQNIAILDCRKGAVIMSTVAISKSRSSAAPKKLLNTIQNDANAQSFDQLAAYAKNASVARTGLFELDELPSEAVCICKALYAK